MENKDTGLLINEKNVKLQRFYFKQAVKLIGIQTLYYAPRKNKHYNGYGELKSFFCEPFSVGIIFEEHPTIYTMKKLGWNTELQEGETLIHVPYDVPGLESGGMFEIPSGLDQTESRRYRILKMATSFVYPSEIVCHIAPLYRTNFEKSQLVHKSDNFSLLNDEEED